MGKKRTSAGMTVMEALMQLLGRLPLGFHHACSKVVAWLLRSVLHYRTDVVMTNLSRSFPDKPYEELSAISKAFYRHFARTLTEAVWFGACRGPKGRRRLHESHLVEITNPEQLNRLYGGARQLMILQTHAGNWELIGGIREYSYGTPLDITPEAFAVTYLRLHSALWDGLMARNRTAPVADLGFDGYVEASNVLRFAITHRDRKWGYSFITDQYPYSHAREPVTFMHQPTVTMTGAAALAVKLDMAVAYLRFECREEGGYRMTFVPISEHAGSEHPAAIMQKYYQLLEEDLERQPWNYLWTHKRWKK